MNDREFLSYCERQSFTERSGFVPEHLARLARLAGEEDVAKLFDGRSAEVIDADRWQVRSFVSKARERLP